MRVDLRFSVRGRARFLSHLESVDTLLAAFRRVGCEVALSQGMRPKPVISLALPRAVGVASDDEIATIELVGEPVGAEDAWLAALAERLNETLPEGVHVHVLRRATGKPHVAAVRYHVALEAQPERVAAAANAFAGAGEAWVERHSPKGTKRVDVRRSVAAVDPVPGGIEFDIAVSHDGFARPEEVARALADAIDEPLAVAGITRIHIVTAAPTEGAAVPLESTV